MEVTAENEVTAEQVWQEEGAAWAPNTIPTLEVPPWH